MMTSKAFSQNEEKEYKVIEYSLIMESTQYQGTLFKVNQSGNIFIQVKLSIFSTLGLFTSVIRVPMSNTKFEYPCKADIRI